MENKPLNGWNDYRHRSSAAGGINPSSLDIYKMWISCIKPTPIPYEQQLQTKLYHVRRQIEKQERTKELFKQKFNQADFAYTDQLQQPGWPVK